ncbi:DedA family protein [Aminobacter sp. UC22_36]|uniref:DedA family protein n=1 Tax=Aminobacter sp. UC22_36 TaxID=3374549 RepID=UPI0037572E4F
MTAPEFTMQVPHAVAELISFGLVGIGCLAIAEKFVPLFPSYVLLMLLGMTVPDGAALVLTIAVTTAGSAIGGLCWYAIGWSLGPQRARAAVARYGKCVFVKLSFYDRLTDAYRRNHFWVTLSGQVIPAVRIYLALPAGALKLETRTFLAATLLGCLMWNTPFLCLGYALRSSGHDLARVGFWAACFIVAFEAMIVLTIRWRKRPASPPT